MQIALEEATPLLHDLLTVSARRHPGKLALVVGEHRLSYQALLSAVQALARCLVNRGVERGDRVALLAENHLGTVLGYWAALMANAVPVVINPQVKGDKLAWLLADCRPAALLAPAALADVFQGASAACPSLKLLITWGAALVGLSLDDALATEGDGPPPRRCIDVDLATVVYTSGSTGGPKGVMQTHRSARAAVLSIAHYLGQRDDDTVAVLLPLAFDYGLHQMVMGLALGGTVLIEQAFAFPGKAMERLSEERVTVLPGVPTLFSVLLRVDWNRYDLSCLRLVTNTAAAWPVAQIQALAARLPQARLFSMYGLTECKRVSYLPPERLLAKPESVGIAIPNTEIILVDEDGHPVAQGQVGQITVRGATVMRGYWENPQATAERLKPGPCPGEWTLFTGDLGRFDADGDLYFVGRTDDIIKSRGEKVPPGEVEAVLASIPGVREVAVVGVPDDTLGHAVAAFVVKEPGAELTEASLVAVCRARLEAYMVPRHFRFLERLPRTDTGKLKKIGLAEEIRLERKSGNS